MAQVGDKIKIINMTGDENLNGKMGKVTSIDNYGQLFGTWGECAIIPLIDKFEILNT